MSGSRLMRFFVVIPFLLLCSENCVCQEAAKTSKKSERLLVVAPKQFHASLEPFIEFKRTIRPTELVELDQILETGKALMVRRSSNAGTSPNGQNAELKMFCSWAM